MALTNPTKLINVQELSYFEGKLAAKYQAQAISVTGITATSVEGALAELASSIGSLPSAIVPKGTKAFAGLTPSTDLAAANVGFMWNISDAFTTTSDFVEGAGHSIPAGANVYVANPETGVYKYDIFSGMYDLSGYATKVSGATSGNFAGLDGNGNLTDSGSKASDFATSAQGAKADTAYQLPSGGVPKTDLAQGVQDSLDLADSAYQKPSAGIPDTDLSSGVQSSLGKADSAVQGVALAGGTNNGTVKLTVDGTATDNIAVTGLAAAAYCGVAADSDIDEIFPSA